MNKSYGLWNLTTEDGKYYLGPEQVVIDSGGSAEPIYSGIFNSVHMILGKLYVDLTAVDLSQWDFIPLTAEQAIQFVSDNFTTPDTRENNPLPPVTLEDLISRID